MSPVHFFTRLYKYIPSRIRNVINQVIRLRTILIVTAIELLREIIFPGVQDSVEKSIFWNWVSTLETIYIVLGASIYLSIFIYKRKREHYLTKSYLITIGLSLLLILFTYLPKHILFLGIFVLYGALVMLTTSILLTLRELKKQKKINLSLAINRIKTYKAVFLVLFVILVLAGLIYVIHSENNTINTLNSRIDLIENKLGGNKKIHCSESQTINKMRPSVVRVVGGEGEGSGFSVGDGLILTNFHVVEFEPSPKVIFNDKEFETGEIIMADKNADLAIIKIQKKLPVISWGEPNKLELTEELLMMGYPFGGEISGVATVTKGNLAANRPSKIAGISYLQTDATLQPGMSGGPMFNVCGDIVGINTLGTSGMGYAISSESIQQKWLEMTSATDSLKDIKKIAFDDTTSAEYAVATFYNYLKVRKLEKAFELLSDNFKKGFGFNYWKQGYATLLDTSVIKIEEDKENENRINVKLSTKDMIDGEIVYKYFEGYWDTKLINSKWRLWEPKIKEVKDPDFLWFY